ncbi:MAG: T9SS type A sorting domain-containing protein, partial [Cytophagia bacterium]|nr:T9SS type A sorting domain-containing protein [Cytophagia bacterium]
TNYSISNTDGTLSIGQAALTATADDKSKTYGDVNPALNITYDGFVNGDDATDITEPSISTLADAMSDVGDYDISLTDGSADNYLLIKNNGTISVVKADLIVKANDKIFNRGEEVPELTMSFEGFVNGNSQEDIDELPLIRTTALASSERGEYPIQLSGGLDNNYDLILVNGEMTITGPVVDLVSSIEFDKTGVKESAIEVLNVDNTGDGELIVSSIEVPVGFSVDIEGFTTDAGNREALSITFEPTEVQVYNGKLILTTNDGEIEISLSGEGVLVAGIEDDQLKASQVILYPNPANKFLTVDLSEAGIFKSTIKMIDAKGNTAIVEKVEAQAEKEIDVSRLTQGVYLLMVESHRGTVIKKVIIKR